MLCIICWQLTTLQGPYHAIKLGVPCIMGNRSAVGNTSSYGRIQNQDGFGESILGGGCGMFKRLRRNGMAF